MLHYKTKNLVISAVGDRSLHRRWGRGNFDLCLIYYGDGGGYPHESEYYYERKGSKYHLIQDVLDKLPDYHYYWFPDDDIYMEAVEINRLFQIMSNYKLLLGQPSLLGWYSVDVNVHHRGTLLRYTNFVEIMCPCFSKSALQICKPYFKENKTGWSYDALWNKLLGSPQQGIAIIDDVVAIHTRPVFGGDLYANQVGQGNPEAQALMEAKSLVKKYDLSANSEANTEYGELLDSEIYSLVQYSEIKQSRKLPRHERFWPPSNLLKLMCQTLMAKS